MISFLVMVYAVVVLALFKMKIVKRRPYPIAIVILAGVFMIGGVVVAWKQYAPMSGNLITSQYVVQLVPYTVKGYVKKVHAKANQSLKKGDLLLEIDPTPYSKRRGSDRCSAAGGEGECKASEGQPGRGTCWRRKAAGAVQQAQAALHQANGAWQMQRQMRQNGERPMIWPRPRKRWPSISRRWA